jgi:predicted metal-dependent hydrolase
MSFLDEAFDELGISKWKVELTYSARFNGYNANIRKRLYSYDIRMSSKWKEVDEEIQKGCVQTILKKLLKLKTTTSAIQLYNGFLKALGEYAERTESDPYLQERFEVLNDMYFAGMMTQPNLEFGTHSLRQLGRYEYSTDTVRISTALKDNQDLLDYVLYHELLHKKHKFKCVGTQTRHHTKEFRRDEANFWLEDAEKKLKAYIRTKKPKKRRKWF